MPVMDWRFSKNTGIIRKLHSAIAPLNFPLYAGEV
jgi:hypothetical protein